jgi:transcription elongation GreA/GreB family factor
MGIADKMLVHRLCMERAQEQLAAARQVVHALREDLLSETKSTAGDKFETGRAMLQQEQKNADGQLQHAQELLNALQAIDAEKVPATIATGSLVVTDQGTYYIAVAIGKLIVDGTQVYVISLASPLGQALKGKKAGGSISLNGRNINILATC